MSRICFKLLISNVSKERRWIEICFKLLFSYRENSLSQAKCFIFLYPPYVDRNIMVFRIFGKLFYKIITLGAHSIASWWEIESDPAIFDATQVHVPLSSLLTPDSSRESFAKITFGKFSLVTGTPSFSHWMSGSGTPSTRQDSLNRPIRKLDFDEYWPRVVRLQRSYGLDFRWQL